MTEWRGITHLGWCVESGSLSSEFLWVSDALGVSISVPNSTAVHLRVYLYFHICWFPCRPCQDYSILSQPMKGILMALFITHRHGEPNVRAANVQMDFSWWHLGRISCGVGIFLLNYSETGYVVDLVLPICEKQCFSNCVLLQDL